MNFGNVVDRAARETPEETAVADSEQRATYAELSTNTDRVADGLERCGVTPDDRVAICLRNSVVFVTAYLGAMKCGAVPVPVNTRFTNEQVQYVLDVSDVTVLVTDATFATVAARVDTPITIDGSVGTRYQDLVDESADGYSVHPRRSDELAAVVYTSGTTGRPKGVRHTHGNISDNARGIRRYHHLTRDDVGLTASQCFHVTGLNVTTTPLLDAGAANWLLPSWDPAEALETIERRGVTYTFLTPAMLGQLLECDRLEEFDLSSLTRVVVGGAPAPVDRLAEAEDALDAAVLEGYGMTETTPLAAFNRPQARPYKPGSVGPPAREVVELRIEDTETGEAVDRGERGELLWRGDTVTPGFERRRHDAERFVERDGRRWLRSGDIGYLDEDGYLFVVDRRDDMFTVGCANVFPREIETVLYDIDGVTDAVVVDALDKRQGVVITAVLACDGDVTESQVRARCREQLEAHEVPQRIEFVDAVPTTAAGKVDRRQLRDRFGARSAP